MRYIQISELLKIKETLTGFKWLGNKAESLTKTGKHFIYAFEEAIGNFIYLCNSQDLWFLMFVLIRMELEELLFSMKWQII